MKTLASLFSVLLATCLLTFVSCSDDDDKNDPPKNSQTKLLPVTLKNESYKEITTIEYDDLARITKIKYGSYDANNNVTYLLEDVISYDDASPFYTAGSSYIVKSVTRHNLDSIAYWTEVTQNFEYTLSSTNVFIVGEKGPIRSAYYEVEKSSGNILKYQSENTFTGDSIINLYTYDSNGNINGIGDQYDPGDGAVEKINVYTYDSNKGIFSDVKTPQRWLLTQLNIFKSGNFNFVNNSTYASWGLDERCKLDSSYTYEYNERGYPTRMVSRIIDTCGMLSDIQRESVYSISIEYKTISEKE